MNELKRLVKEFRQCPDYKQRKFTALEIAAFVASLVDEDLESLQDLHAIARLVRREVAAVLGDSLFRRNFAADVAHHLKETAKP